MTILSKTESLETSIATMQRVLDNLGCGLTFAQEKHPLSHCYSINLASTEAPRHIYANGKGTLSDASKASALGEYIERLQTNHFFTDFHLPQRSHFPDEVAFDFDGAYLNAELKAFYEHDALSLNELVDFNSDDVDSIIALPFEKLRDASRVYFPINILNTLYVSNGLATGNSADEAKVQALSEIFERYVKFEIIKNGYALPSFPPSILDAFTDLRTDVALLENAGYRIDILDASLGGQFPVTAISLINPRKGTLFVSFGSHPLLEVSLSRTMSELMQGRDLNALDAFEIPTFDMALVEDPFNLESHFIDSNGKMGFGFLKKCKDFAYVPWGYQGLTCKDEFDYLQGIVSALGKEIYLREYTYLGFYSCQILVPAFSEIYPTQDLIYHNKNDGKSIRDMVLNTKAYKPLDVIEAMDGLEDALDMEKYLGVLFESNFTMGLFKAHVHLSLGNLEEALVYLEDSEELTHRIVGELIRLELQGLAYEAYENAFETLFTAKHVEHARLIVEAKTGLIDTTFHKDYINLLNLYDKLWLKKVA